MAKSLPEVSFRSRLDSPAAQAFIETGSTEPASSSVKLSVVHPTETEDFSAPEAPAADAPQAPTPNRTQAKRAATPPATAARKTAKGGRQVLQRIDGREVRKRTIYIPSNLSVNVDVACAQLQRDFSEVAEEALQLWVAKNAPR